MAGYSYGDDEYTGPHRAAQFDTMNLGEPHRAAQFDTMNLGAAPHRVPQFDTMNLGAPVRAEAPTNRPGGGGYGGGGPTSNISSGQTPMNPVQSKETGSSSGGLMHSGLVIANLALRGAAAVVFIIALAIIASDSQSVDTITASYSSFSATKYALAAAIIGAVYSIYETVSAAVRLAMDHPLLPGKASLFVSYIGDQVMIVLVLTGASAAAATIKNLHDLPVTTTATFCDVWGEWCNKATGAVAMLFIGYCFLAASLVISSYCFYRNKS